MLENGVEFEGMVYPSVEHAYQAAKTKNLSERVVFQSPDLTAGKAKRLGSKLVLRDDWEEVKISIMKELNFKKFSENESLREKLLATGIKEIVEGNNWGDTFWGVCKGVGENNMGKILMRVRGVLSFKE
jgi:ribA/ribD-fused uncharacterized protein